MPSVESIALELRSVHEQDDDLWSFFDVLIPHFADKVKLEHLPTAFPMDGMLESAPLAELMKPQSAQIMKELMPDYREIVKSFSVSGETIVAFVYMTGTLSDGTEVRVPAAFAFGISDDRLVQIDIHSDPADYGPFVKVLAESGLTETDFAVT